MVTVTSSQIALVTGGGSGIGRGIALALAQRGLAVAVAGRRPEPLQAVVREIEALGGRGAALPADLAELEDRLALPARLRTELGPPALLIHNAALMAEGSLDRVPVAELQQGIAVNLAAPVELTRLFLPDLIAQQGMIVLVASGAALLPLPYAALYSATKSGLAIFGQALRFELAGQGVGVLVAYPPPTSTAMTEGMDEAAGVPFFPRAAPETMGARIAAAALARRGTLRFWSLERVLAWLHGLAPGLAVALLRTQQARFERLMNRGR